MIRALVLGLLCFGLLACAHRDGQTVLDIGQLSERIGGVDWLQELRQVQQLPDEEQASALRARQRAFRADPSWTPRMRLALLRALGTAEVRNEAAALALLEAGDLKQLDEELAALVALLRQLLQEQARQQALLKAERKLVSERDLRIGELEQQLEALTSIEQSIKERQKAHQGVTP